MKLFVFSFIFFFVACTESGINNLKEFNLSQVGLNSFPYSNMGKPWDSLDAPDLILEVYLNNKLSYSSKESQYVNLNYLDLPIWFNFDSLLYLEPSTLIKVKLFDMDSNSRDLIDTIEFQPPFIFELPLIENITSDTTTWRFHYVGK
ncbi:MAG: hypothetical protein IPM92_02945 [Saprospiraceae bacterium]|nr:hypothetical protein [Saprospiraceae bacterium]